MAVAVPRSTPGAPIVPAFEPLEIAAERCKGCELCIRACPKHCLALDSTIVNPLGYHPIRLTDAARLHELRAVRPDLPRRGVHRVRRAALRRLDVIAPTTRPARPAAGPEAPASAPPRPVLMKGNEAIAEAAIQAGCDAYFGYPITPQAELLEWMARRMPELGRVFVQAESELAAINMALGAAACGARVLVSSSSPGISLMAEGMSYMAGSELPGGARQRDARRPRPRQHRAIPVRLLPGDQGPRPRRLPGPGARPVLDRRGGRARRRRLRARRALPDADDDPGRRRHGPGDGAGRPELPDAGPRPERVGPLGGRRPAATRAPLAEPQARGPRGAQPAAPGEVRDDRRARGPLGRGVARRRRDRGRRLRYRRPGGPDGDRARPRRRAAGRPVPADHAVAVPRRGADRGGDPRSGRSSSSSCRPASSSRTSGWPSAAPARSTSTAGPAGWSRPRARSWRCCVGWRPPRPGMERRHDHRGPGDPPPRLSPAVAAGRAVDPLLPRLRPRNHPSPGRRAARRAAARAADDRGGVGRLQRLRLRLPRRSTSSSRPTAGRRRSPPGFAGCVPTRSSSPTRATATSRRSGPPRSSTPRPAASGSASSSSTTGSTG